MRDGVDSKTGYKRVLVVTGSNNLDLSRQSLSFFIYGCSKYLVDIYKQPVSLLWFPVEF